MQTFLVTGGSGFIGSHLCDALIARGHRVICIDNLQTGSLRNIAALLPHDRFTFLPLDVELPLCSIDAIDGIFNLACPASPLQYQVDPVRTMRTNVVGAINVLDLARRTGARIVQASTSEVYGDPEVHPQREAYLGRVNSFGPRACYDEGKRAAETLFHDYSRMYGVDIRIARIFNTYGPRMAEMDGRVVSNFIRQALRGEPITIFGKGTQTRSFCFVSDMVTALILLMASGPDLRRPCNLGNPEEVTMATLAGHVLRMTGSDSRIIRTPLPQDDPTQRQPDIAMARAALGWTPSVPLETGLATTIAYFRSILVRGEAPQRAIGTMVGLLNGAEAEAFAAGGMMRIPAQAGAENVSV